MKKVNIKTQPIGLRVNKKKLKKDNKMKNFINKYFNNDEYFFIKPVVLYRFQKPAVLQPALEPAFD